MPKGKLRPDLENLKNILEKLQFKTKAYTGSLLSTEKGCKINIYLSGKIVIITRNEEQFVEVIDNARSPHLWKYIDGEWQLRHKSY